MEDTAEIWSRFEREVPDAGLRAASAAFAYVACADGHLDEREVDRFVEWAGEHPAWAVQAGLDVQVRALGRAFGEDFSHGEQRALQHAAGVTDAADRDRVLRAAQIAVVADGKLQPVEESALRRVCEALGVEPDAW